LVTKEHIEAAIADLNKFSQDYCEKICEGDADCIRKCRGESLKSIGLLVARIDPAKTTPDDLRSMPTRVQTCFSFLDLSSIVECPEQKWENPVPGVHECYSRS
jgi:hypothetical protein